MHVKSNRLLLLVTLFSYFFSILSAEKWDLPMMMALPVSCLGIYDVYTFLVPASGFSGVLIMLYLLVRKTSGTIYHNGLLLSGLLLLWVPFIAFQDKESLHIEWQHGFYLFIPELIFGCCFILLVKRILFK